MTRPHRSGRWVAVTRRALVALYGSRCHRCGMPIDLTLRGWSPGALTIGHVIPLARGGGDNLENLRPEHARCNRAAGASMPELEPRARIVRYG